MNSRQHYHVYFAMAGLVLLQWLPMVSHQASSKTAKKLNYVSFKSQQKCI